MQGIKVELKGTNEQINLRKWFFFFSFFRLKRRANDDQLHSGNNKLFRNHRKHEPFFLLSQSVSQSLASTFHPFYHYFIVNVFRRTTATIKGLYTSAYGAIPNPNTLLSHCQCQNTVCACMRARARQHDAIHTLWWSNDDDDGRMDCDGNE